MSASNVDLAPFDTSAEAPRTPKQYLDWLLDQSLSHPALNHPWLRAMSQSSFPDMAWAVRDFAWHYHGYSSWFPHYLRAVIGRLDQEEHRQLLLVNLQEENGQLGPEERITLRFVGIDPDTVDGVPHPALFRRFCEAMGIGREALAHPDPATIRWRSRFRSFLEQSGPPACVGALGLGTESVVKTIYEQILPGIKQLPFLDREDYVFFDLHCVVDDQHQEDLLCVARDLIASPEGRAELRRGMLTALDLRCELWDRLYSRAMKHPQAASA